MYYIDYENNEDIFTTKYKEVLSEEDLENRLDWDSMGLVAPEDEDDFKWEVITLRKSHIYAITEEEDGYALIWGGGELLVIDMTVKEAMLKIFGVDLDMSK